MRKSVFYTLVAIFFSTNGAWSQGFEVASQGFSSWKRMTVLPDGGVALIGPASIPGGGFLQKASSTGTLLWVTPSSPINTFATDVAVVQNEQIVVLTTKNTNNQNVLYAYQPDGTPSWNSPIPPTFWGLNKIAVAQENGGLAAGSAQFQDNQLAIKLVRFDINGSLLWTKIIQEPESDLMLARVLALPDGTWMLGGTIRTDVEIDYFLANCDDDGNLVWFKKIPKTGRQTAYDLLSTTDGGLALLGYTQEIYPSQINILKTDNQGNVQWDRSFFTEGGFMLPGAPDLAPLAISFCQLPTGDFYIPYTKAPVGQSKINLIRLDNAGRMLGQLEVAGASQINQIMEMTDQHLAICGSAPGSSAGLFLKCDQIGQIQPHRVTGSIYRDSNPNCIKDSVEAGLIDWIVEARPLVGNSIFTTTKPSGTFSFSLPPGNYRIIPQAPARAYSFWQACDTPQINLPASTLFLTSIAPIGLQASYDCPALELDVQAGYLQPCRTASWHFRFSNQGSQLANNTQIRVEKSPLVEFHSASLPLISATEDTLFFLAGALPPGYLDSMVLRFDIPCEVPLGQAIRIEAALLTDNNCIPPDPGWDGAVVAIEQLCSGQDGIQFTLLNKGMGNMGTEMDYVIIEDQIILSTGKFKLNSGEDRVFKIENPTGAQYWMRAGQSAGQAFNEAPTAFANNCLNPGLIDILQLQLPETERRLPVSIHTGLTTNGMAYPFEIVGYPTGWQAPHLILADQELEYLIEFTNNSQDPVYTINVTDSLPAHLLDISTFRPGAGSMPYHWELGGEGVLRFHLGEQALLPDQTGFVSFRIQPKSDLPAGTIIRNKAQIRLDYAPPFLTEGVFHTIGSSVDELTPVVKQPAAMHAVLFPNPIDQWFWLIWENWEPRDNTSLQVVNLAGHTVMATSIHETITKVDTSQLPPGIYFIQLHSEKQGIHTLRMVKI